ncbi:MAG: NAD-dependent epimerase/dehydratase family protein [Woeseiaceae bacterium]
MFAVVAGTGYTGRRVLEKLPADASLGLGRTPIDTDRRFEIVDFDAPGALSVTLPDPCTVLYTCPPDGERDDRLQRFLAALPHSPNRIVYISTTGVYGDCAGAVVTEDTPVNADNRLSRPRVAAEELLTLWAEKHACDLVILRVPGIYGPGRLGVARLKSGEAWLEEADANPGNRIHVDDLADCCIAALAKDTPPGIYNVGDGDYRTATWFAGEVARQAGLPAPRTISREAAAREFSPLRLAFLSASRRVDARRMRETLGVTPRTPEQGIRDSLAAQEGLPGPGFTGS